MAGDILLLVPPETLSVADVARIHNAVVQEFGASGDPIWPPGIKSQSLLESAVSRQHTSIGRVEKYPDSLRKAATLTYGIVCDHPFHNGNKRTALVSMLVHLDRNRLRLGATREDDLYRLMLMIAQHNLPLARRSSSGAQSAMDREVEAISRWLKDRVVSLKRGERVITFRQLRPILDRFGFELERPDNNFIGIVRVYEDRDLLLRKTTKRQRLGTVAYPGERAILSLSAIKRVREICGLREEDGYPSDVFYEGGDPIDTFINQHRRILQKLSNK